MCGRDWESRAASVRKVSDTYPVLRRIKPRTADGSLSVFLLSGSPPPLLDALEKSLSYPVSTTLPFFFYAFAL
jgi:hypothetical protein